jgi:hypothetical protein
MLLVLILLKMAGKDVSDSSTEFNFHKALWLGIIIGLGLSNHWPLLVLFSPAFLILSWPCLPNLARKSPVLLFGAVIGLTPYIWMVVRSNMAPEISFAGPIDEPRKFMDLILRRTYVGADYELGVGVRDKINFIEFQTKSLINQMTLMGVCLALLGLIYGSKNRAIDIALLSGAGCTSFLLIILLDREYSLVNSFVYRVYPLPFYAVVGIYIAVGLDRLKVSLSYLSTRWLKVLVWWLFLAMTPILPMLVHASKNYRANYVWAEEYAKTVLDELPDGARLILFSDADLSPGSYVSLFLGYRSDIELVSGSGLVLKKRLFDPWLIKDDKQKSDAIESSLKETSRQSCFVGISHRPQAFAGVVWRGITACYNTEDDRIYNSLDIVSAERFADLQMFRTSDNWTMMVADTVDGHMVDVLLSKFHKGVGEGYERMAVIADDARNGLRGKLSFLRSIKRTAAEVDLESQLELLVEAEAQAATRAYTKNDKVELYRLKARILDDLHREAEAENVLLAAIEHKPTWRNPVLPTLLTRLFRNEKEEKISRISRLDPDLNVVKEIYEFYIHNKNESGLMLSMVQEDKRISLSEGGVIEIE